MIRHSYGWIKLYICDGINQKETLNRFFFVIKSNNIFVTRVYTKTK